MSAFPFLNDGLPLRGRHVHNALFYGKYSAVQRKKFIDYLLEHKEYDSMLYCIRFSGADGVPELSPAELEALVSGLLGDKRNVSYALQLLGFEELPEELRERAFLIVAAGGNIYVDILRDSAVEYKLTPNTSPSCPLNVGGIASPTLSHNAEGSFCMWHVACHEHT